MKRAVTGMALGVAAVLAAGSPARAASDPVPVLATVGMIGDLAAEVGGDCAAVEVLIGAGNDPHLYQPRASDIARLQDAQVVFHVGLNLEGRLGEVLERLSKDRIVVALGETAVPADRLLSEGNAPDPHLWMDVALWAKLVPEIARHLATARPDCDAALQARAGAFGAELAALDAWARDSLASIPEASRVLVTAHDAFGYMGRAYGVQQVAIQGFSTESEASVADIRAVADTVVTGKVPAVFVESTINPRTIEAMLEAVTAAGGQTKLGGALFSDAMGEAGTPEGSYIGMIRANVLAITEGLGGKAAPWPEALRPWAERHNLAP
jgi:manganese/zinc/iron transport system substrate-binding protein